MTNQSTVGTVTGATPPWWHESDRTDIRREWDYAAEVGISGFLVEYRDRDKGFNDGQPAPSWELWTYETYGSFRDQLLHAVETEQDPQYGHSVQVHQFVTKDTYHAFAVFYPFDRIWTIHLMTDTTD